MRVFVGIYNYAQENIINVEAHKKTMYDAMLKGLMEAGNDVLCIDCASYKKDSIPQSLKYKIIGFDPDVCIICNFGFWDLTEIVDCPIVLFDVDSINHMGMATMSMLRNTLDRYKIILSSDVDVQTCKDKLGAKDSQVFVSPLFIDSGVSTVKEDKSINILYFGENKTSEGCKELVGFLSSNPTIEERVIADDILEEFIKDPMMEFILEPDTIKCKVWRKMKVANREKTTSVLFGASKLEFLSYITELGLTIKGTRWFEESIYYHPELAIAAKNHRNYSYNSIENVLNDSKVCLYFNEGPYVRGEYLRILEMLSSSSCLVAQKGGKHDWLLEKAGVPLFETKEELYDACKNLLANEKKRVAIVRKANKVVKQGFTIDKFLEVLNKATGLHVGGSAKELVIINEAEL
jgi:glycosyltransferase involved in cell wall biosynthesis